MCRINKGFIKRESTIDLQRSLCKGWFLWPTPYTYIHSPVINKLYSGGGLKKTKLIDLLTGYIVSSIIISKIKQYFFSSTCHAISTIVQHIWNWIWFWTMQFNVDRNETKVALKITSHEAITLTQARNIFISQTKHQVRTCKTARVFLLHIQEI
jgi:hypothetical protein